MGGKAIVLRTERGASSMNWKDKKVRFAVIFCIVILAIICFQIGNKLITAKNKAERASKVKELTVETTFPKRQTITPVLKLSGNLDPVWQADVAAKISARVEKIYVKVGDRVVAGQLLAKLDGGEHMAQANGAMGSIYNAQASLAQAETTLARYKKLYTNGAISKADLDNAQFARDMAAGKLNAAQGDYDYYSSRADGTEVIAPEAGTVVKRYFQEGYYTTPANPLFNIADISSLIVKINIPEGQIGGVHLGATCKVEIPAMSEAQLTGTITKLAQVADLPERTFAAEVTVDNSDNKLKGGLFANVYLTSAPKNNILTIPQSAIVMREDQRTVFVVDEKGRLSRKVLETGYIGNGLVEVLGGLTEQDEIVTAGQNRLREGNSVKRVKDGTNQ